MASICLLRDGDTITNGRPVEFRSDPHAGSQQRLDLPLQPGGGRALRRRHPVLIESPGRNRSRGRISGGARIQAVRAAKVRNHSMFVDEAYRQGAEYKEYWLRLNRGRIPGGGVQTHRQGEAGKSGSQAIVQPPILRSQRQALQGGEIRHATPSSGEAGQRRLPGPDRERSRKAMAAITIRHERDSARTRNHELPERAAAIRLDEVKGRHHGMFVDAGLPPEPRIQGNSG